MTQIVYSVYILCTVYALQSLYTIDRNTRDITVYTLQSLYVHHCRVAQSAGIGGLDPSIAKDLIDSKDPKHTLFCREIAFVAIYALFRDNISIL